MADVLASLERMSALQDQPRNACLEEKDVNVHGDSKQQIYDYKNTQQNDILPLGTVASPSTPVQFSENNQRQKRSKKKLFQRGIAFLARGMDIWSMGIPDVEIRTTDTNELISHGISLTTNTTPSNESKISGNRLFSALSDTDMPHPKGRILPSPNLKIFSFSELQNATRTFSHNTLLGEGRFGQVYRGRLDEKVTFNDGSGSIVAVKKLDNQRVCIFEDWQSAVGFLGGLSHPNLVKLLGYCSEDRKLLLVYEFMPRGSLENHLFGRDPAVQPLPWDIRLKILIGAARGLAFLQTLDAPVICREFKASNILLDESFHSKISDFSYEELDSPESSGPNKYMRTRFTGTHSDKPYVPRDYVATDQLYGKSDVYGFGVVLLEMLTGLRVFYLKRLHEESSFLDWEGHNLVNWFKPYLADKRKGSIDLASVMDSRLKGKYPQNGALRLAHLARDCLESCPKTRPSMKEVVETLEHINASNEKSFGAYNCFQAERNAQVLSAPSNEHGEFDILIPAKSF